MRWLRNGRPPTSSRRWWRPSSSATLIWLMGSLRTKRVRQASKIHACFCRKKSDDCRMTCTPETASPSISSEPRRPPLLHHHAAVAVRCTRQNTPAPSATCGTHRPGRVSELIPLRFPHWWCQSLRPRAQRQRWLPPAILRCWLFRDGGILDNLGCLTCVGRLSHSVGGSLRALFLLLFRVSSTTGGGSAPSA